MCTCNGHRTPETASLRSDMRLYPLELRIYRQKCCHIISNPFTIVHVNEQEQSKTGSPMPSNTNTTMYAYFTRAHTRIWGTECPHINATGDYSRTDV